MAPTIPLQLRVQDRRCVVVGAGKVGARRALALHDGGARVLVVAPEIHRRVAERAGSPGFEVRQRPFEVDDLEGALLVVVASGVPAVDDAVVAAATDRNALVNHASDASAGDVAFPAVVRRGPVAWAVSTDGRAPAVARWVAARLGDGLDELLGLDEEGLGRLVEVVDEVRSTLRAEVADRADVTPLDWQAALDESILDLVGTGRVAEAKERLLACLSSS